MHPYEPRPIRFHGIRDGDGWRLKRYSIAFAAREPVDSRQSGSTAAVGAR